MPTPEQGAVDSQAPGGAYRAVEGAHLRQWLLRAAVPLAVLASNGAGLVRIPWLPGHDALGLPAAFQAWIPAAGAAAVAVAAWIRVLSKGVLVRKTTLTTEGVYRVVRHPFYLANLLGAAGVFLLAGPLGAAFGLIWLVPAAVVYGVTVAGEEEGLARLYPEAWAAYAARVPALLPIPGSRPPPATPATGVTWANLVAEREPARLLRFLAGAALVAGCWAGGTLGWALVGTSAVLFTASHLVPGPPSRRRSP